MGTSNSEVWGPGARFQIDATILDVYLLSRIDRRKIIGRPVLYVVIDVYSRMIVGIYIGLEGPSWVAAMMALANAVEDKQSFCKKYGREIEPHEWPCHHVPAILLGDRGEILAKTLKNLINNFNIQVENTASFRADWKGIVEQRFKLLPAVFKTFVDGYIQTDYRERGASDYRLDATLDIDQITSIIIECVLYYNNSHEIKNYDKDIELAGADFAPVPIDLWEWGIANKSGALRQYPLKQVKFALMPTEEATITLNGIKLKSSFYTCQRGVREGWFDKARQDGRTKVQVSFDPRDMDIIYLHRLDEPEGYVICHMTSRSRAYAGQTCWEIAQAEHFNKVNSAGNSSKQRIAALEVIANSEKIVEEAKSMKPSTQGISAASRTKNIRENRATEKSNNRNTETFRLSNTGPGDSELKLPPVPNKQLDEDDYSEPDIIQILNLHKGDQK